MSLKECLVTKADIIAAIPELMNEINTVQKMKKDSSRIQFGQIQKLMFEKQQAMLLRQIGFNQEADLVDGFFGELTSYAGLMLPYIMGEGVKSVDSVICEIFQKKTVDIAWYN